MYLEMSVRGFNIKLKLGGPYDRMTSLDSFCFENGNRSGRRSIAPNGSGRFTLLSMVYRFRDFPWL